MADPYDPYLKQAQTLFDEGDVVKAGQIWQAILKRDPGHAAARAGLYRVKAFFDARATQDGLVTAPEAPEPPTRQTLTPPPAEVNSLLDAGCALYDAGLLTKAIATWETVLVKDPENPLARGYIDGARRKLDERNPPEPAPEAPRTPEPEAEDRLDKLLRDGCTLFDMGQAEDALLKWEQILAEDPGHALARAYANDARKDLGLAPMAAGRAPSAPAPAEIPSRGGDAEGSRADVLVREGVQIYDMGMTEEAIEKWHQALALEPDHEHASGYLDMARRDKNQTSPSSAPSPAAAAPSPEPPEDPRLLQAETLLRNHRFEEAAQAFQRLLEASGRGNPRALQGYQQARAMLQAREAAPGAVQLALPPAPAPPVPSPVGPPRAIVARAPARQGLHLPASLGELRLPPWLATPRNLALACGALLLLALGLFLYRSHQRDAALLDAVASAKSSAMAPIARRTQVVVLGEALPEIRAEGQKALGDNPLLAYYRAQECLRLDPGDAAAAQLLERARSRMAEAPPLGSPEDLDRSMKNGDLDSARAAVCAQLAKAPDDPELKAKAQSIFLALVESMATREHFGEARELLLQGRALFPQDPTWGARLKLLEEIQGMAKADRARWIPLLG